MSVTANPQRGEAKFVAAGRPLLLRPSFENLVAAEAEIGSLFALVERASEGSITISEITALIWHCINDTDRPERDEVGKAVLECGLVEATKPIRTILSQVLQGRT